MSSLLKNKKKALPAADSPSIPPAKAIALKKARKRKKLKKIAIGVLAVFIFLFWYGSQPLKAGREYGVCRTFVELNIPYPTTFKITEFDKYGPSLRLFFTYTDEFGATRSQMIECLIKPDPVKGLVAEKISIDREPIPEQKLADFNASIPGILQTEMDLRVPRPVKKDDFTALKRD